MPPPDIVGAEVAALVRADQTRLGQVFRLSEQGLDPERIAKELGVNSSNFVSNNRIVARALIEGMLSRGDSPRRAAASKARGFARTAGTSSEAHEYLERIAATFQSASASGRAQAPSQTSSTAHSSPMPARVRWLARNLIQRIEAETGVCPADYESLIDEADIASAVSRHISAPKAGATFLALFERRRLDLTLESFVVDFGPRIGIDEEDRQRASDRLAYFSKRD